MRISIKTLQALCEWINEATSSPKTPYTRVDGKMKGNIGNYHLSQAYGGVCIHLMCNESGGVSTPIWHGHISKREAESQMRAFLRGLELNK